MLLLVILSSDGTNFDVLVDLMICVVLLPWTWEFLGFVNTCFFFFSLLVFKLLTYSFIFLHLLPEQINHPILITECVCNPVQSRSKMAELLFETYGVPSIGTNTFLILQ